MKIIANGKPQELPQGSSVKQLLDDLNIPGAGTAVAVNNKLVRKPDWEQATLYEGDQVVIISAAYGG